MGKKTKEPTFEENQKKLEEQMKAIATSPQFIWNMSHNLQFFMIHAFTGLIEHKHSHPAYLEFEEWQKMLKRQRKMWKWLHKHHDAIGLSDVKMTEKYVKYEKLTWYFFEMYGSHLWD